MNLLGLIYRNWQLRVPILLINHLISDQKRRIDQLVEREEGYTDWD